MTAPVRAYVQREEWWPVWEITVSDDGRFELSPELVARYDAALREWEAVQDELRALVASPVSDGIAASPVRPSPLPAGTHKPEADTPQGVAADTAVVDAESDTVYGDAVQHSSPSVCPNRATASTERGAGRLGDEVSPRQSEDERRAWLRRVQAER